MGRRMKSIIVVACVILAVSAQRFGGGRPGGLAGRLKPKCSDGGKPTCTCANGDVIDRPRPNPCGDNTIPTCVCADGTTPTRGTLCNDGNKPTCANGVAPVCQDGNALDTTRFPPCTGGPPKCADGGALSCADGTSLGFLANFIG